MSTLVEGSAPAAPENEEVRAAAAVPDRPVVDPPHDLRRDFGAHVEANYRRLVAQLYAITLNSTEAHDAVQDAYSRAWRSWSTVGSSPDPAAWVRRVAVGSTIRSWRRVVRRRPRPATGGVDPRAAALLEALARLPAAERRTIVLHAMAGMPLTEIAAIEGIAFATVTARLGRAKDVVSVEMADAFPEVLWSGDGGTSTPGPAGGVETTAASDVPPSDVPPSDVPPSDVAPSDVAPSDVAPSVRPASDGSASGEGDVRGDEAAGDRP